MCEWQNVQVILCANQDEMLYFLREHKGHEGIKGTPVEEYQQILIHDHNLTFYKYGADHQELLSHVLRYLQDSIDKLKKAGSQIFLSDHQLSSKKKEFFQIYVKRLCR